MNLLRAAFLSSLLATALSAHAVQDCELNGESVNPSNGNTTAGKTGLMRCKDRDSGVMAREQELKDGKFMGLVRFYEKGKLQREHSVNEKGNRHGRYREFASDGQMLRDAVYDNSDLTGLSRSFHPNGKLRRIAFNVITDGNSSEQAYAEFNDAGQLSSLRCGDKALLAPAADDARWCGFSGTASQLEFFGSRGVLSGRSSYLGGKRIRHDELHANGQPNFTDEISGDTRLQRNFNSAGEKRRERLSRASGNSWQLEREQDFSETGVLTRDRRWAGGKAVSEQTFYLNGQPRRRADYNVDGDTTALQVTDYYDSGKVASVGRYSAVNRSRQLPVGTHQRFSESGKVVAEAIYDERGRITREKVWDDEGKLLRDDALFEDGSRKAFAR